jgi:hypothetical protein
MFLFIVIKSHLDVKSVIMNVIISNVAFIRVISIVIISKVFISIVIVLRIANFFITQQPLNPLNKYVQN